MMKLAPPPRIAPVPGDRERPMWSVMIPTYKPSESLRETLQSVFAARARCQSSMQLEIVDDCSPGVDIAALLKSWGLDDVALYRRSENGGLGQCWNTCIERARGQLVHILHHDDVVDPAFYATLEALAIGNPDAGMLFTRSWHARGTEIWLNPCESDEPGVIADWLTRISTEQRLECPSVVVRRRAYEQIGGFDPALKYVIDWEMWVRLAAHSKVVYCPQALATYREHVGSETQRLRVAGAITEDFANAIRRIEDTLSRAEHRKQRQLAVEFAIRKSSEAVAVAEGLKLRSVAAKELLSSIRHWGLRMGPLNLAKRLKWYFNLRRAA